LFASETEKDDVNEDRGGIVSVDATITSGGGEIRYSGGNRNRGSSQLTTIVIAELRIIFCVVKLAVSRYKAKKD
jgi:hypothetical protein